MENVTNTKPKTKKTKNEKSKRNEKYYSQNSKSLNEKRREKTKTQNEIFNHLEKMGINSKTELENYFSNISNGNNVTPTTQTTTPQQALTQVFKSQSINQVMIKEINVNNHDVNLSEKYIQRSNEFRDLEIQAMNIQSKALCFIGRSGTGKTMIGKAYAEKKNLPCMVFTCSEDIRKHDLLGNPIMENGSSLFMPSAILQAIEIANKHHSKTCILILDEVNTLEAGVMKNLNENMNWNEGIYVPLVGKKWKLNSDSKIIVIGTLNPNYTATNDLNRELISRFSFRVWSDWTEKELRRLFKAHKLSDLYTDCIINLNNQINTAFENDELSLDQDSREMVKIIESFKNHQSLGLDEIESMNQSLELNVISKYALVDDKTELKMVESFIDSIFPKEIAEETDEYTDEETDENNLDSDDPVLNSNVTNPKQKTVN